jgi:hypothetical protein
VCLVDKTFIYPWLRCSMLESLKDLLTGFIILVLSVYVVLTVFLNRTIFRRYRSLPFLCLTFLHNEHLCVTMEIDEVFTKKHVDKWTKAWNDHNLEEILSFYCEKILFHHTYRPSSSYLPELSATITM